MSIRWIRNVLIEGEKSKVEIQIGDRRIGDKCYTRINDDMEQWFDNNHDTRNDIISQGITILKKQLQSKEVTYPDGKEYDWQ